MAAGRLDLEDVLLLARHDRVDFRARLLHELVDFLVGALAVVLQINDKIKENLEDRLASGLMLV